MELTHVVLICHGTGAARRNSKMNETAGARRRRWSELRGGHSYGYVLALVIATFLFVAIAPNKYWVPGVLAIIEAATLVVALWTSREGRIELRYGLAAIAVAVAVVELAAGGRSLEVTAGVISGLLVLAVAFVVGRGVINQGIVNQQSVIGAICIYLLLGMLFVFIYSVVAKLGSGPFFVQGTDGTTSLRMYFSFVTLTTVGYGDYTPATNLGHTLAISEALIGQLYLVTVVAVLVSRIGAEPDPSGPPADASG